MNIILVNKYWYLRGGTERVLFATKQILEDAGHEVHLFGMHHEKNSIGDAYFADYVDYDTPSIQTIIKSIYNTEAKKKFEELIHDVKPDVVHFHNIYHQLSYALLDAVKDTSIRTVMTLHDYKMLSPNYTLFHHGHVDTGSLGKKYYRCLLNNCMESYGKSIVATIEAYVREKKGWQKDIDRYIAPSVFMKDLCVASGWDEQTIKVVPNPIEIETIPPQGKEGEYVAYIGRLTKEKGVHVLIDAAKQLPHIPFRIIGDGRERDALHKKVQKEKIMNVVFEGWQTGNTLHTCMQEARCIVVPSLWYENCPLSILEPMAMGKVVIASDIGGITEHLPKEVLVPPGDRDTLAKRIDSWYRCSSRERREQGMALQKKVAQKHSMERYKEALMRVYT